MPHVSSHNYVLGSDEFRFQHRLSIFKQHCYDFLKVSIKFIQGFRLRMRTLEAGDKTYIKACVMTAFNNCRVVFHMLSPLLECVLAPIRTVEAIYPLDGGLFGGEVGPLFSPFPLTCLGAGGGGFLSFAITRAASSATALSRDVFTGRGRLLG